MENLSQKKSPKLKIYKNNPIEAVKKKKSFPIYYTVFATIMFILIIKFLFSTYNFFSKSYKLSEYKNEIEKIDLIIKNNYKKDLVKKNSKGQTPLWLACYNNNLNLTKHIIKNIKNDNNISSQKYTAFINYADKLGDTPLWWACFRNNKELAYFLLENGAKNSINIIGDNGYTALEWAYKNNNTEIAKILIQNGAKARENSLLNLELMYYACLYGNLKLVKYLVKSNIKNNSILGNKSYYQILQEVKNKEEIEIKKKFFEDLYSACLSNDPWLSSFIVSSNKIILYQDDSFLFKSIYLASVTQNLTVVKYLIENYA